MQHSFGMQEGKVPPLCITHDSSPAGGDETAPVLPGEEPRQELRQELRQEPGQEPRQEPWQEPRQACK